MCVSVHGNRQYTEHTKMVSAFVSIHVFVFVGEFYHVFDNISVRIYLLLSLPSLLSSSCNIISMCLCILSDMSAVAFSACAAKPSHEDNAQLPHQCKNPHSFDSPYFI